MNNYNNYHNNKSFNIYKLYYEFIISQPIISSLSFIFILFYVFLTIYFPKYYGKILSLIPNNNKQELYKNIYNLIIIYLLLWCGTLIHYFIIHGYLLKKSRSFFLKKLFYPIWNNIENGNIKDNISSNFTKNILSLVITSSQTLQGLIFIAIPLLFSIILFVYYLPNILSIKLIVITTFIIILLLIYKFSSIIKQQASNRINQTKQNLEIMEDIINNKLTILNFNSSKKEFNIFNKNCKLQEIKCFNNGLYQIILTVLCIIILLIGLLTPIFLLQKKLNLKDYKTFLITYIPMITSIIIIFYTTLSRFIAFFQTFGEQENSINNINNYFLKNELLTKIKNNKYTNHLKLNNIYLKFNNNVLFNNLNIEFKKGINLIKGPIGSGKSCILKMIFGILNYQKGNIYYKNKNKNNIDIKKWRENIVYINQFPSFFETKNINQNIYYNYQDKLKINDLLIELDIKKKFNYLLKNNIESHQLSGGEKQIICFIRSIINNKKEIYLIDEPTASLDENMKKTIYNIINKLKKNNKIIIVVSHDNYFKNMADNIIDINALKKS